METHALSGSLLRSLLLQRVRWRVAVLAISLGAALLGILAPYAQKRFADDLLNAQPTAVWILAAFGLTLSSQCLTQLCIWLATRESIVSQKALSDRIYERMLEGSGGLVGRGPAGAAVSLFAVDVPGAGALLDQALVMAASMIFPLFLAPIALHAYFGIPWWACGAVLGSLTLVNFLLAKRQSRFFYSFKQLAAERTGLVSEWVQNIRTLRILGWTEAAERRIFSLRRRETRNRKGMVTNGQLMNSVASSATFACNVLAVLLLLHLRGSGARPTPGELLSLLWILGVFLAKPLRQLPWAFVMGLDSWSSIRRLEDALKIPISVSRVKGRGLAEDLAAPPALEVRGLQLEIDGRHLLENIDLSLPRGSLTAVVGEVGSGKSLLLQSLVGIVGAHFESFSVNGNPTLGPQDPSVRAELAFVPQEGFTMSASLRENVLFEYLKNGDPAPHDEPITTSLRVAQFAPETERVTDGIATEIGERGVNLSGGQRQRIALARAHFADRPVLLLDDCLSAVDVDTEKRLIDELILGAWGDRTRLLVTHRMTILPDCDEVIFLENGRISQAGTYEELRNSSARFREFVRREEVAGVAEHAH